MKRVAISLIAPSILLVLLWVTHGLIWRGLWFVLFFAMAVLMFRSIRLSWRISSEREPPRD